MPFYMRGPGIPAGVSLSHPTTHVDLAATLLDLAGRALLPSPPPINPPPYTPHTSPRPCRCRAATRRALGRTFVQGARGRQQAALQPPTSTPASSPPPQGPLLSGTPHAAWRNFSLSEYYDNNNTWVALRRPAVLPPPVGVPSVAAAVAAGASPDPTLTGVPALDSGGYDYHWWCTGSVPELFSAAADPFQLHNLASGAASTEAGAAAAAHLLPLALFLANCSGDACNSLRGALGGGGAPPPPPLACRKTPPTRDDPPAHPSSAARRQRRHQLQREHDSESAGGDGREAPVLHT